MMKISIRKDERIYINDIPRNELLELAIRVAKLNVNPEDYEVSGVYTFYPKAFDITLTRKQDETNT